MNQMFCFQCEQTAGCTACTGAAGVCGKSAATAGLQDKLTGAAVSLAVAAKDKADAPATDLLIESLFATLTNVNFDDAAITKLTGAVHKRRALFDAVAKDYDMSALWNAQEDIRSLKSLILFGLRGMAAYAHHAMVLGFRDTSVNDFFYEGMAAIAADMTMEQLVPLCMKLGTVNLACLALLDKANTETYGVPAPVTVEMTVQPGPFIVVSGHDLRDLHLLLEQTKDSGVSVYTHGEMLPAHAYPKLKAYSHLVGHFGTAWQNQQKEFASLPGSILFTTNCLMPVKESYADRVYATGVVGHPGIPFIGENKDFAAVIGRARMLGGYDKPVTMQGVNGGSQLTTGFSHRTVLSVADKVIEAVKAGAIKHFFLVGGCDGAKPGRNYYTDFVKQAPSDSMILTLGCGKYRFNDLDIGSIGGLPRILDMGQCNDAYGAIQVAVALAGAFGCGVNDLPLTLVLSWYEQKAVCILLTLLSLGIKNIRLGPSLPAFVSPAVLNFLVEQFAIAPTTEPKADLAAMLA